MPQRRKVSVIIVNYNTLKHIDTCLSSILKQTYPDYEVIFVDNNSTDNSLNYAKERFPGIIFVTNNENLGYAGGVCSALTHASGQYIAPLNIDTEVTSDWLIHMVEFLDRKPEVAAVTPKILLFNRKNRINALGVNIHVSGLAFCRELDKEDRDTIKAERVYGLSGCSYLIRKEVLEQINNSVKQWDMFYDDVIVSWLVNLMGYDIWCLPESVIYHKYALQMNPDKFLRLERCRHIFILSVFKPLTIIICFPVLVIIETLIMLYSVFKGRQYGVAKLKAIRSILKMSRNIRRKRKLYKKLRKRSDIELLKRLSWNLEWGQLFKTISYPT